MKSKLVDSKHTEFKFTAMTENLFFAWDLFVEPLSTGSFIKYSENMSYVQSVVSFATFSKVWCVVSHKAIDEVADKGL